MKCADNLPLEELRTKHAKELGVEWDWRFGPKERQLTFMCFRRKHSAPKGNGAIAITEFCHYADRLNMSVYLWTEFPRLYSYYEAFGFAEVYRSSHGAYRRYIRQPTQTHGEPHEVCKEYPSGQHGPQSRPSSPRL